MKATLLTLIFSLSFFNISVEKTSFYNALSSNSASKLEGMLEKIEKGKQNSLNLAYKGALIAKISSFEKNAKEKIKSFKLGISLLETEINKAPKEVEYRFLRLTIQENSPKVLKYKHNIEEDIEVITNGYASLGKELKSIIGKYAKSSTKLSTEELK